MNPKIKRPHPIRVSRVSVTSGMMMSMRHIIQKRIGQKRLKNNFKTFVTCHIGDIKQKMRRKEC